MNLPSRSNPLRWLISLSCTIHWACHGNLHTHTHTKMIAAYYRTQSVAHRIPTCKFKCVYKGAISLTTALHSNSDTSTSRGRSCLSFTFLASLYTKINILAKVANDRNERDNWSHYTNDIAEKNLYWKEKQTKNNSDKTWYQLRKIQPLLNLES